MHFIAPTLRPLFVTHCDRKGASHKSKKKDENNTKLTHHLWPNTVGGIVMNQKKKIKS
jgi:hypothetical protein